MSTHRKKVQNTPIFVAPLYPPPPIFVDSQKVGLPRQEGGGDAQPLQTGSDGRQQK